MKFKRFIAAYSFTLTLFLVTACGSGSNTDGSHGPTIVSPNGVPTAETNPVSVATPTPSATPDANATPTATPTASATPASTPTPNGVATPTATPQTTPSATPASTPFSATSANYDAGRATNFAQSVYDVQSTSTTSGTFSFEVGYYDLDRFTSGQAPTDKAVHFSVNTSSGANHFDFTSDDSSFTASVSCTNNCTEGTITVNHTGASSSKLTGSTTIQFFTKRYVDYVAEIFGGGTSGSAEASAIHALQHSFSTGSFSSFNVVGGFTTAYTITIAASGSDHETVTVRGQKTGNGVAVNVFYRDNSHSQSFYTTANVTISTAGFFNAFFTENCAWKAFQAYGWN